MDSGTELQILLHINLSWGLITVVLSETYGCRKTQEYVPQAIKNKCVLQLKPHNMGFK